MRTAEALGWVDIRRKGDHRIYKRDGAPHNLSIPDHREVGEGTLRKLVRTMGLTVDEFIAL
jgi:predicted RNA binding protein YcfA (HicA-like mRNA interferase family)